MNGNSHIVWTPGTSLEQIERQAIELTVSFYRNKAPAARSLGITVRTLETKLKRYKADDADEARNEHDRSEDRKRRLALQRGSTYDPVPYVEPEETQEPAPADGVDEDDPPEPSRTIHQQKLKDGPPVIPPPAPLSAKIVGAR